MATKISPKALLEHLVYISQLQDGSLDSLGQKIKKVIQSFPRADNQKNPTAPATQFKLTELSLANTCLQKTLTVTSYIASTVVAASLFNHFAAEEEQNPNDTILYGSFLTSILSGIGSLSITKHHEQTNKVDALAREIFSNLQQAIQERCSHATIRYQITSKKTEIQKLGLIPQESLALASLDETLFLKKDRYLFSQAFSKRLEQLACSLKPFSNKVDSVLKLLSSTNPSIKKRKKAYTNLVDIANDIRQKLDNLEQKELQRRLDLINPNTPSTTK